MGLITSVSILDQQEYQMEIEGVTQIEVDAWRSQGPQSPLIQNAFPNLSAGAREFILSGITPEKWDEMFGEPEVHVDDLEGDESAF